MLIGLIFGLLWIGCGILEYGVSLHEHIFTVGWLRYPWEFLPFGIFSGPIGLLGTFLMFNEVPFALRFKPLTKEQRWVLYTARFPSLDRESFEANDTWLFS